MIKMDVPGMKKDEIKIQIDEDGNLSLTGERQRVEEKKEANYHRTERSFGKFTRQFKLPPNVNKDSISAEVKDGVLTVTLPKSPTAARKVQEIPVVEASSSHDS